MTQFEIKTLDDISLLRESSELECKQAGGKDGKGAIPKDMWETYSSFANTNGGTIILGLKEKRNQFSPTGIENIEQIKADLFNTVNSQKVSCNLLTNDSVQEVTIDGKNLLIIYVRRAKREERPVFLNGNPFEGSYIRAHEADQKLSAERVKRMMAEQIEDSRDNEVLPYFDMQDIDIESLRIYRQNYTNLNPTHAWNELDNQSFLKMIGGWRKNRETGEQGLTVAGLLMFGIHPIIQEKFPYYMLDYQERPEAKTERRWVDRLTLDGSWSGNLYDFSRKVYRKLIEDLKIPFVLEEGIRQEDTPVHIALREALANTIIHADYTGRASVLVVKRPDMFGFRNPGTMRVSIETALQGGEPDCRNRLLAQMFRYIKFGEQAGSGLPNILDGWKSQHWKVPLLREASQPYEQTLLELRMIDLYPKGVVSELKSKFGEKFSKLSELERTLTITIYSDYYLTHQQLCSQTSAHTREVTLALVKLERAGIISSSGEHKGKVYHKPNVIIPTPDNESGQFLAENVFVSNPSTCNDPQEGPELDPDLSPDFTPDFELAGSEWNELEKIAEPVKGNSRKAGKEAVNQVIKELCQGRFIGLNNLSILLDMKPDTLRKNYLNPLVANEQLRLAYPTTRNHPKQAYTVNKIVES
ncbi:AAA family ATPase [Pseudoalteromonas rubra]|uniref:AAA family ATPase n=1 Tax=Pseudoalteromonas rubra TaxID=43658 RepID=A0A5S3WI47_9GAMM|nr:RNA-binding domain-containing protein [Pseudoalteromonas rubra]TMP26689.1 AAA family ATPase [Pseudoalteromonas rubra]TMP30665.1 AAA family ATPase [Pseudoalteromonas rubra]